MAAVSSGSFFEEASQTEIEACAICRYLILSQGDKTFNLISFPYQWLLERAERDVKRKT